MATEVTVSAEPRESRGKNEARRLRVKGFAPGVLYGANRPAVAVSVNPKVPTDGVWMLDYITENAGRQNGVKAPRKVNRVWFDPINGRMTKIEQAVGGPTH